MYKILICDDERDIRNALRIYLTGEGYAVCEADSGLAALELMQREEVQLVLMDIMMPGMDGMTATAKLREQSNVPVILITAKSEDNDKILGLSPSILLRSLPASRRSSGAMPSSAACRRKAPRSRSAASPWTMSARASHSTARR